MLAVTLPARHDQVKQVACRLKRGGFRQNLEGGFRFAYNKIAVCAAKPVAFDMFGVCLRIERRNVQRGRVVQRCHQSEVIHG